MFTSHGTVPPLVTFSVSNGFSPGPYTGLSVEAETVTRFWLQAEVAEAVGDGVAEGVAAAETVGVAAADGLAETDGEAVPVEEGSVEDACCEPPLKAAARAKPLTTSAITRNSAPPTTSRRRRYTAALGFRTLLEPVPRGDELPSLPILLG